MEGLVIFREMHDDGIRCTSDQYALLIHLFIGAPQPMLAECAQVRPRECSIPDCYRRRWLPSRRAQVFEAAKEVAMPEEAVWSGMVKMYSVHGALRDGVATLDEMLAAKGESCRRLIFTTVHVIRQHARASSPPSPHPRPDESLRRVGRSCHAVPPRLRSFAPIITAAAEVGDRHLAQSMAQRVADAGLALSAAEYVTLASMLATDRQPHALASLFDRLEADHPTFTEADLERCHATFGAGVAGRETHGADDAAKGGGQRWRSALCEVGDDGLCSATQLRLRTVDASAEEREQLCAVIPRLVGYRRDSNFQEFMEWVQGRLRSDGPLEYVLDGANIGFFGHGREAKSREKDGGKASKDTAFNFEQIDRLLRAVLNRSTRVMLVLHVSHTQASRIGPRASELVARWRELGVLYISPAGHNDDWYWLYAAMASGDGCRVISNDEMRDHHFGMLAPRSFIRWKEQHVVHFKFDKLRADGARAADVTLPEAEISSPPNYSRQTQQHACGTWHFPSSQSSRWLCVWHDSYGSGNDASAVSAAIAPQEGAIGAEGA